MNKKQISSLIVVGIFGIVVAISMTMFYTSTKIDTSQVEVIDFDALIELAKLSRQPYLESILLTVRGAMLEGTLAELTNYTAAYSEHAIKEHPHLKIETIHPQKNKKTRI